VPCLRGSRSSARSNAWPQPGARYSGAGARPSTPSAAQRRNRGVGPGGDAVRAVMRRAFVLWTDPGDSAGADPAYQQTTDVSGRGHTAPEDENGACGRSPCGSGGAGPRRTHGGTPAHRAVAGDTGDTGDTELEIGGRWQIGQAHVISGRHARHGGRIPRQRIHIAVIQQLWVIAPAH